MIQLLDHGYLSLVESWGTDERIIESARMSTGKGFLGWQDQRSCSKCGVGYVHAFNPETKEPWPPGNDAARACAESGGHKWEGHPGDEKLLRFLWENKHATPFEMAGLTIEVKAPIMVFREWHRHRVPFGYNELSARYVPLPDENYCPTVERIVEGVRGAGKNKQAQGVVELDEAKVQEWLNELVWVYGHAEACYQRGLEIGVPKELARLPVPVARYSRMRATGNLRGWLAFMSLRAAPAAQWEIRQYANALGTVIAEKFPRTWSLFAEGAR
jgi:thymidylate synthase (FAD)